MGPGAVRWRAGGAGEPFRPDMNPRQGRVDDAGTVRTRDDRVFESAVGRTEAPCPHRLGGQTEAASTLEQSLHRRWEAAVRGRRNNGGCRAGGPDRGRVGLRARRGTQPERFRSAGVF